MTLNFVRVSIRLPNTDVISMHFLIATFENILLLDESYEVDEMLDDLSGDNESYASDQLLAELAQLDQESWECLEDWVCEHC